MTRFARISSVAIDNPSTWEGRWFLTFDVDWAHDAVLQDVIELLEPSGVAATWFVTHKTPLVRRLQINSNFEVGIRPNFNPLLNGDNSNGTSAAKIIDTLLDVVPRCRSVRSHSLAQSGPINRLFADRQITHSSNCFVPERSGIHLRPWFLSSGLIEVPYCWADEHCEEKWQSFAVSRFVSLTGLVVFDFHPIHVFLNTEHLDRYERTRSLHQNPTELIKHRYEGYGTRNRLMELLALAKNDVGVLR